MLPYQYGGEIYIAATYFANAVSYMFLAGGVAVMLFIGRVLDMSYWEQPAACWLRRVWYALAAILTLATVISASQVFSAAILLAVIFIACACSVIVLVSVKSMLGPSPAMARSFGYMQILSGVLILIAQVIFLLTQGKATDNCASSTYWSITATREWTYYEVDCPFEVEISPFENATADAQFYSCSFREETCTIGDYDYAIADESLIEKQTEITTDGSCRLRTAKLIFKVARDFLSRSALDNINMQWMGSDAVVGKSNGTEIVKVRARYHGCSRAFLLWSGPLCMSVFALWIGVGTLVVILPKYDDARNADRQRKILARGTISLLLLMWIGASIGGSDMNMSQIVIFCAGAGIGMLLLGYISAHGINSLWEVASGSKFGQQAMAIMISDWGLAFMALGLMPVGFLYLLLSIPCQFMRKINIFGCNLPVDPADRRNIVTKGASAGLKRARALNWTSILTKVIILGLLFMSLNVVVSKFTSVAMSALNEWIRLQNFGMGQITMVFFAVGMAAFLNPLIPGPPIYVSGGIVLVEGTRVMFAGMLSGQTVEASGELACTDLYTDGECEAGYWIAIAYTVAVCTVLKMCAITVQQKVFGERMGRFISIRRFIGVNTVACRAIKIILQDRGLTMRKVFILCGGPDWPTSVTTGILGLPLLSMLIGSLPIVFLIAPSVLAGASLLRTTEGSIWSSISVLAVGLSVVLQSASMFGAMHVIAKVATEHENELAAMDPDLEVLEYTKKSERKRAAMAHAKDWHRKGFPLVARFFLIVGAATMILSVYLAVVLGSACFGSFSVSDSISEDLGGDPFAIVLWPLGYLCLLLLAISVFCFCVLEVVFSCICKSVAQVSPEEALPAFASGKPTANDISSPLHSPDSAEPAMQTTEASSPTHTEASLPSHTEARAETTVKPADS
ncbi:Hypothetical Protein FCC1311_055982 [Hondaea fermentalgiana]|uniref:Uncharacterized protein n=1 Tax=Hondaea fermentalgiana TaxID=2315210 RepID=A0A2R5GEL9_9STRA|nr:Hypothetical Protein FCC1311_055982 [Hondaea fermentalgiana]|eukprot:GBG29376.1 Hypothetical Protein FCC1311_055982 [Hondaea fermentalgiana]